MKKKVTRLAACAMVLAALHTAPTANAEILTTNSRVKVKSYAPASVQQDQWESNKRIRVFQEKNEITLTEDVHVNFNTGGVFDTLALSTGDVIAAGTVVDSYFIHHDKKSSYKGDLKLKGMIRFDTEILGVIVQKSLITASDQQLGAFATMYGDNTMARGIEMDNGNDFIKISNNRKKIVFKLWDTGSMDQIRVLTAPPAPVPSPGSAALLALAGLAGLSGRRRA